MKIVLLSTGHPVYDGLPGGGGIQHQILGLGAGLSELGHEVHVIYRNLRGPLPEENGIVFHPLDVKWPDEILSVLNFSRKATRLIDDIQPDVVSTFERFSAYYPSRYGLPMTFTTENYDAFRYYRTFAVDYNSLNALIHPWKRRLEEGVMKRSSLVIALTPSIADYLASIGIHHVEVIPNGVHASEYRDRGDGKYILYAGRLDKPKGLGVLIEAFSSLTDFHDEYSLKIVGKGPSKDELRRQASGLDTSARIEFEEWVPREELADLLGNCTVFALPSLFEALPVAMLEAMAASKPVVASDISGPRDVIEHMTDGLLCQAGSVSELAANLRTCLQDSQLRQELGRRAREKVRRMYNFSAISRQLSDAYARVVQARATQRIGRFSTGSSSKF